MFFEKKNADLDDAASLLIEFAEREDGPSNDYCALPERSSSNFEISNLLHQAKMNLLSADVLCKKEAAKRRSER